MSLFIADQSIFSRAFISGFSRRAFNSGVSAIGAAGVAGATGVLAAGADVELFVLEPTGTDVLAAAGAVFDEAGVALDVYNTAAVPTINKIKIKYIQRSTITSTFVSIYKCT